VTLREPTDAYLEVFFQHLQDPEAGRMAAFTPEDPSDRGAFLAHWERLRANPSVTRRTILTDGEVVGHLAAWDEDGEREVTYWIGREHWGRGLATRALATLLEIEGDRPMRARVAKDNAGSIRVLEKCGFRAVGEERGFATARGEEIAELVYRRPAGGAGA
jgi:RimJ/RimL family protein N-acetyltransferase